MTLDCCLSLQAFLAVKGHFCEFLVSNIFFIPLFLRIFDAVPSRVLPSACVMCFFVVLISEKADAQTK